MYGNVSKEELFEALYPQKQEASWCKTYVKRDNCKIQADVSLEEKMISHVPQGHLKVKAECREYINDTKLKNIKNELLHDLGVRGRRI